MLAVPHCQLSQTLLSIFDICAGDFDFVLGTLVRAASSSAVMVSSDALSHSPNNTHLSPIFSIACAWPRAGVGFGGGWDRLTCCRRQIISKGVVLIVENDIFFVSFLLCW